MITTEAPQTWIDSPALAALLGVPLSWVQERTASRAIPHHRVGRYVRFSPADVRAIERDTAVPAADHRQPTRRPLASTG